MAGQAGPRPALSGRPARNKVLILGAGMSGLVLGYELGKLGYDYRILEARDRVGGLAWTVRRRYASTRRSAGSARSARSTTGSTSTSGAWRIPFSHTGVLDYCRELNVPVELFVNEADGAYFFYEGSAAGALANKRVRLREVKADMVGHTNELIVKAIDQKQLDLPLTAEDKERFVRYLVAQGYLDGGEPDLPRVHRRAGQANPYELSALLQGAFTEPPAIDSAAVGHDDRHDVPASRRHGPDREGLPARDRGEPPHPQRRGRSRCTRTRPA